MRALITALVLLHGVVTRGPTTPVCQVGVPCALQFDVGTMTRGQDIQVGVQLVGPREFA